ncbi:hypothetical protein LMG19282_01481 [Cupriavidus campinensis]|uniref:hypothetical protein n=1 Tax=Cupriavidus campinensis TaxID=151783 RepID=UPI0016435261|nr:hypothetical protein [Cupriavidus campinensis]CAG2138337.1 hypothetical protein LMG19282_01481 [Cupriavidus campinensis]
MAMFLLLLLVAGPLLGFIGYMVGASIAFPLVLLGHTIKAALRRKRGGDRPAVAGAT